MSYQAVENNPIIIDVVNDLSLTTGWSIDGINAVHVSCNSGICTLISYPITAGITYQISYIVTAISGGNVQPIVGGTNGVARTTSDLYVEEVTAGANGFIQFYSNANCTITSFNIVPVVVPNGITLAYSSKDKKWSDFRNLNIDWGWSLFDRVVLGSKGALYASENGSDDTNNFFGVAYQSSVTVVEAKNPGVIKDFETISYQANMLLVTTIDGVKTSNGQVTTLIDTDFIKQKLVADGLTIIAYQNDNVYSASFLGDENEDIVNGSGMRGGWMSVELVTVDGSTPLELFTVAIKSRIVPIGSRP